MSQKGSKKYLKSISKFINQSKLCMFQSILNFLLGVFKQFFFTQVFFIKYHLYLLLIFSVNLTESIPCKFFRLFSVNCTSQFFSCNVLQNNSAIWMELMFGRQVSLLFFSAKSVTLFFEIHALPFPSPFSLFWLTRNFSGRQLLSEQLQQHLTKFYGFYLELRVISSQQSG